MTQSLLEQPTATMETPRLRYPLPVLPYKLYDPLTSRVTHYQLAQALQEQDYPVTGPDLRGRYHTTTDLCHHHPGGPPPGASLEARPHDDSPSAVGTPERLTINQSAAGFAVYCNTHQCGVAFDQQALGQSLLAAAGFSEAIIDHWNPRPLDEYDRWVNAVYAADDGGHRLEFRQNWPDDYELKYDKCPTWHGKGGRPKRKCNRERSDPHKHLWSSVGKTNKGTLVRLLPTPATELDPEVPYVMTEGPHAANYLRMLGWPAVNWCGGAGAAKEDAELSPLYGKNVILWPDNDATGYQAMNRIARRLEGLATVHIAPGYGKPKGDAADCPEELIAQHLSLARPANQQRR